jgi:uncharacterized membrane protein YphA (DoxX/SURF4 family)
MTDQDRGSLRRVARGVAAGWQAFFHEPCDARGSALVRMMFAVLVALNLATLYPRLDHWFTADGVLPAEASRAVVSAESWSLLWLLPDTSAAVHACFWIALAQTALLGAGCLSRLNALGVFVWLVSFQTRNSLITDGEDDVFKMIAFCLIWMPSGRCWSLDAWLRRRRQSTTSGAGHLDCAAPAWGVRLLQLLMAMIFLSAGVSKLDGDAWLDGTALYYVARLDDFFGRFPVPDWPFDTPWAVAVLTWSVVIVELTVPLLIWFPETRRACLAAVLLFHLGNEWTMHLFLFHWIMLCGWLSFVTPDDLRWLGWRRHFMEPQA